MCKLQVNCTNIPAFNQMALTKSTHIHSSYPVTNCFFCLDGCKNVSLTQDILLSFFSQWFKKNSHNHKRQFAGLLQNISRTPLQDTSLPLLEFHNTALISSFLDCIQTNSLNSVLDNLIRWNVCISAGMLQPSRTETGNSNLSAHSREHFRDSRFSWHKRNHCLSVLFFLEQTLCWKRV